MGITGLTTRIQGLGFLSPCNEDCSRVYHGDPCLRACLKGLAKVLVLCCGTESQHVREFEWPSWVGQRIQASEQANKQASKMGSCNMQKPLNPKP